MEEGEWWGRGREIFIKIEHRFLRSGLDLTLLSLPWPLFHSPVVDLQSSWEGGKEKTKKKITPLQERGPGDFPSSLRGKESNFPSLNSFKF